LTIDGIFHHITNAIKLTDDEKQWQLHRAHRNICYKWAISKIVAFEVDGGRSWHIYGDSIHLLISFPLC
jgi:hypothetical protein